MVNWPARPKIKNTVSVPVAGSPHFLGQPPASMQKAIRPPSAQRAIAINGCHVRMAPTTRMQSITHAPHSRNDLRFTNDYPNILY
jgi:hypothetical protein